MVGRIAVWFAVLLLAWGCGGQRAAQGTQPAAAPKAADSGGSAGQAGGTATKEPPLSPPVKVKMSALGIASDAGLFIALEKGYFLEEGLEVEIERFTNSQDVIPALATGQIDVGGGAITAGLFNAIQRDIPLKLVADKASYPPDVPSTAVVVRKELMDRGAIKDFADLKGKTVAIGSAGSNNHIEMDLMLRKGGLTFDDVNLQIINIADMGAAIANGSMDVGILTEPFVTRGVEAGLLVRWKNVGEIYPNHQAGHVTFGTRLATERPEVGKRWMVAYVRALRDYMDAFFKGKGNKAELISMVVKHSNVKDPALWEKVAPIWINPDGYMNAESVAFDVDWFVARDLMRTKPDLKQIIDNQFVDYAIQRLGRYK